MTSTKRKRQQTVLVDNDNSGGLTFGQFLLLMIVLVAVFVALWEWILKDIIFPPETTPAASGSGGAGSPPADVLEPYEKSVSVYDITLIVVLVSVILMTLVPMPLRLFLDLDPVTWGYVIAGVVFVQCISGTIMFATTFDAFQKGREAWPDNPEVVSDDISWEGITVASASFLIASTVAMVAVFAGGAAVPGPVAFLAWLFFFVVPLSFLIWYVVADFDEYFSGDGLMILMVATTAINGIMAVLLMLKTAQFVKSNLSGAGDKAKELFEKLRQTQQKLAEIEDSAEKAFEREKLELQQENTRAELRKEEANELDAEIDRII